MAVYRISGIWVNSNKVITHYAFHTVNSNSTSRAVKTSKSEAIRLLEIPGNECYTWIWNYNTSIWNVGERVEVVNGELGKYLRSNADKKTTDNLAHLIDLDWINP